MVRLTSNSTGSSAFDVIASLPSRSPSGAVGPWSQLRTPARAVARVAAEGCSDRDGESDAGERVVAAGVGYRHDHTDDESLCAQQRTAGATRIHGGVELDQSGQRTDPPGPSPVELRLAVQARNDSRRRAVAQPERVADGHHVRADADSAAESGRYDDFGQLCRRQRRDVFLRV